MLSTRAQPKTTCMHSSSICTYCIHTVHVQQRPSILYELYRRLLKYVYTRLTRSSKKNQALLRTRTRRFGWDTIHWRTSSSWKIFCNEEAGFRRPSTSSATPSGELNPTLFLCHHRARQWTRTPYQRLFVMYAICFLFASYLLPICFLFVSVGSTQ